MKELDYDWALRAACQADILPTTRVHFLPDFGHADQSVWVKREDESGFGISGCKKRKYASLLPWLRQQGREVVLIGGPQSNHVVGLTQLLHEAGLPLRAYLRRAGDPLPRGNGLLRQLLLREAQVRWVDRAEWPQVEALARAERPEAVIVPEGGHLPAALPGACTLWGDLRRNEAELGQTFEHLFIDSGTAFMAGSLLGMKQLFRPQTHLHVVLTAGDEAFFHQQYARLQSYSTDVLPLGFPSAEHLHLHPPVTARSFGAVNRKVKDYIPYLAQRYGILTDPVYTAKLFMTAQHIIRSQALTGHVLIIHSGGGTGLLGFTFP